MTEIAYFLLAFGMLRAICATAIGLVCWWPIADDHGSLAALLRRFEWERMNYAD